MQKLICANEKNDDLDAYFTETGARCLLLVCGGSFAALRLHAYFETLEQRLGIRVVKFSDFCPNPERSSAEKGARVFAENNCDLIVAAGGGSAIDTAKCIKLFAASDDPEHALQKPLQSNTIPLLAIPTTAGSGSEATQFAVFYENGVKHSADDAGILPDAVCFDADVLKTLPLYQKKSTMLDAVCHAMESYWSLHSNAESMKYAGAALQLISQYAEAYLDNTADGNRNLQKAAYLAGKAIYLTRTTAGHAMCYQLTVQFGIPHGYAAALCVRELLPYMQAHPELCIDPRGAAHLEHVYKEIAAAFGCPSAAQLPQYFAAFADSLFPAFPVRADAETLDYLTASVNPDRLQNHPVRLTADTIRMLYQQLLEKERCA